jgi:hypothetical protein
MTLGWHIGKVNRAAYFFKEGGGGGFHSEMRLYRGKGIGSVVMVNSTDFDSSTFLNRVDAAFLSSHSPSIPRVEISGARIAARLFVGVGPRSHRPPNEP